MPHFQYIALDGNGREVRGNLEADDRRAAAASLRDQTLFVVEIKGGRGSQTSGNLSFDLSSFQPRQWMSHFLPVLKQDLVLFFRQLGLMLRTGLTLLQALEVCRDQASKPRFAKVIQKVSDAVQSGKSLSSALADHPSFFPAYVQKLVSSAEASGELDTTLERASVYIERRAELQAKMISSLIYPAIVVVTSIAVAAFLVVKVIPQFAKFFQRRGAQLPWATQFLMDLSAWLMQYGPYLLAGLGVTALALTVMFITKKGRAIIHYSLLWIPVVGPLLTVGAMAQFTQTLSVLLESGLTLLESLKVTSQVIGNLAIAEKIRNASDEILTGQDLAKSIKDPLIPSLVTQVIAVGERTGALSQVLDELGNFYDKMLQAKIQRMSALIEPVMILVVGGMVGFVYFAFFQAVLQLASR